MTDWEKFGLEMTAADAAALLKKLGFPTKRVSRSHGFRGWEVVLADGREAMVVDGRKVADAETLVSSVIDELYRQRDVVESATRGRKR